ncbi:hypothetical protein ACEPAF_7205 [Sanghuangporus sanghuang]
MSTLDSTYGCLFLTLICIQLWFYVENYIRTDRLWLKICVILLWILDTVYVVLVYKFLYIYFVREFGNTGFLDNLPKDINGSAPFSPTIAAMVQAFFVMRAWNLSNNNYFVTGGLAFLVLAQLVVTIIYLTKTRTFVHLEQLITIVNYERAMNVITFVNDTSIALVLMYYLWTRRSAFQQTQHIIKRLVAFTIGTGLIVGIMMIIAFVSAEAFPNTLIYVLIDFCVAKMYYNCMLASLNARSSLRESLRGNNAGISFHLDDLPTTSSEAQYGSRLTRPSATAASDLRRDHNARAIECRVEIDVNRESDLKDIDGDSSKIDYRTSKFAGDSEV